MGWNFKVKFFQKNLDCLAKLFSLVQCKLVKKSKLMHAKCKQLFHSSTFRILHWNFEPPLLILDTEKWGRTRVWKPRRIGVGRVKGGIKRETRAGPEMGVLKEWKLGEISRNHATMLNILQLKKSWREAKKNRLGGQETNIQELRGLSHLSFTEKVNEKSWLQVLPHCQNIHWSVNLLGFKNKTLGINQEKSFWG